MPDLGVVHAPQPGLDLRDRAAVQIPPGELCLTGKSFLCPACCHPQAGKVPSNAVLLLVLQYRSLTMPRTGWKTRSDIGAFGGQIKEGT